MSPAQSNSPQTSAASAPQAAQVASAQAGERRGSPLRIDLLNSANKALKLAEGVSGVLPVVGGFVGAVAKVGLTMVEMVQVSRDSPRTVFSPSHPKHQGNGYQRRYRRKIGDPHLPSVFSGRASQQPGRATEQN